MTLWTVARQAPVSIGFSRQEYCSGLPFPPLGDLPNVGIEAMSSALQAEFLASDPPGKPSKIAFHCFYFFLINNIAFMPKSVSHVHSGSIKEYRGKRDLLKV